jgi:hypothetical protein
MDHPAGLKDSGSKKVSRGKRRNLFGEPVHRLP